MSKGVLYGVGVGPGDPGLLTLKAVEVIKQCPVVAAPRTPGGAMTALDIASAAVDMSAKTVLPLDFAMSRDTRECNALHRPAADALRPHLDAGTSVALLNLGDVSLYSSFRYVADILGPEGYTIEMVAGVPSFCAAAAALGTGLTDRATPILILPDTDAPSDAISADATRIWMKSGRRLPELIRDLDARGELSRTMLVQNCGMEGERILPSLENQDIGDGYFTVVIQKGRP